MGYPAFVGRARRLRFGQARCGSAPVDHNRPYDGRDHDDYDCADHYDHVNNAGAADHYSSSFYRERDLGDSVGRAVHVAHRLPGAALSAVDAAHELLGVRRPSACR